MQSSLLTGIATKALGCTRCVPGVPVEEIIVIAQRTSSIGRLGHRRRPCLSRVSHQNSRNVQKSYSKQEDLDVQRIMEPSHKRRSYIGKRRTTKGKISRFLHQVLRISRVRFLLGGGVGLSHPKIEISEEFKTFLEIVKSNQKSVGFMLPCILFLYC
jgi:hypothetical protein